MSGHDELLARTDRVLNHHGMGWPTDPLHLIEELAAALRAALVLAAERLEDVRKMDDLRMAEIKALRAALAAQPEPLFSGRVVDATASARFTIQADSAGVTYPGPNAQVVVYPVAAGSATPEEEIG